MNSTVSRLAVFFSLILFCHCMNAYAVKEPSRTLSPAEAAPDSWIDSQISKFLVDRVVPKHAIFEIVRTISEFTQIDKQAQALMSLFDQIQLSHLKADQDFAQLTKQLFKIIKRIECSNQELAHDVRVSYYDSAGFGTDSVQIALQLLDQSVDFSEVTRIIQCLFRDLGHFSAEDQEQLKEGVLTQLKKQRHGDLESQLASAFTLLGILGSLDSHSQQQMASGLYQFFNTVGELYSFSKLCPLLLIAFNRVIEDSSLSFNPSQVSAVVLNVFQLYLSSSDSSADEEATAVISRWQAHLPKLLAKAMTGLSTKLTHYPSEIQDKLVTLVKIIKNSHDAQVLVSSIFTHSSVLKNETQIALFQYAKEVSSTSREVNAETWALSIGVIQGVLLKPKTSASLYSNALDWLRDLIIASQDAEADSKRKLEDVFTRLIKDMLRTRRVFTQSELKSIKRTSSLLDEESQKEIQNLITDRELETLPSLCTGCTLM